MQQMDLKWMVAPLVKSDHHRKHLLARRAGGDCERASLEMLDAGYGSTAGMPTCSSLFAEYVPRFSFMSAT